MRNIMLILTRSRYNIFMLDKNGTWNKYQVLATKSAHHIATVSNGVFGKDFILFMYSYNLEESIGIRWLV
eukprot:snap_masked-scaffold_1-processed-gene-22.43-mRNA-1 protein AED:1.00 eAED:1.00 QI:0/0/0/0/1/1/3/0/69